MILFTMPESYPYPSVSTINSRSFHSLPHQGKRRKRPRSRTRTTSISRNSRKRVTCAAGTLSVWGGLTTMMTMTMMTTTPTTTMMIGSSSTTRLIKSPESASSSAGPSIFVSAAKSVRLDEKKKMKTTSSSFHGNIPHQRCIGHYLSTHYSSAIVDDDKTFEVTSKTHTTSSNETTEGETSPLPSPPPSFTSTPSFLRHLRDNVVCEPPSWMMTVQQKQTDKSKTPTSPPSSSLSNKRGVQKDDEQSKKKSSIWNTKKHQKRQQQKKNKNEDETSHSSETANRNMSETDIEKSSTSSSSSPLPPTDGSSYNVLMLLSEFHHRSIQSQLIVAATLLSRGMNVTVIYFYSQQQQHAKKGRENRQTMETNIPLQVYSLLPSTSASSSTSSDEIPLFQERFSYMDAPYEVLVKEHEEQEYQQDNRRRTLKVKKQRTTAASKGTMDGHSENNDDENVLVDSSGDGRESPSSNPYHTDANKDTNDKNSHNHADDGDGYDDDDDDDDDDTFVQECHKNETPIDQPFNNCDIKLAPAVLRFLNRHFTQHQKQQKQQQQQQLPDTFDVIVHDGTFLGGLMFSELQKIPSVAVIFSYQTLSLALEHDPQWTSTYGSFLHRMYQVWKQRLYSLSLTNVFMKVNKMRKLQNTAANAAATINNHHLPPFKSPMDVFLPVAAFFVEFAPKHMIMDQFNAMGGSARNGNPDGFTFVGLDEEYEDDHDISGNSNHATTVPATKRSSRQGGIDRIHFTQPLIPPCSPCINIHSDVKEKDDTSSSTKGLAQPIIMVSPTLISPFSSLQGMHAAVDGQALLNDENMSISPEWTRSIVEELVTVRRSLELYDECSWDPLSCTKNGLDDLRIVWLRPYHPTNGENKDDRGDVVDSASVIYPDYFDFVPSVSLLDSLVQHPSTVAVITHCEAEAQALTWLGVDVICISRSDRIPQPSNDNDENEDDQLGQYRIQRNRNRRRHAKGVWKHVSDPADVGTQLLKIMKRRQKETREFEAMMKTDFQDYTHSRSALHPSMDGISQIVSIVGAAAKSCKGTSQCATLKEMNSVTARAIMDILHPTMNGHGFGAGGNVIVGSQSDDNDGRGDEIQPYETFTVLVSWLVFLAALGYVLIRDFSIRRRSTSSRSSLSSPYHYHPSHNNHRYRHRHAYNGSNKRNSYGRGGGGSSNDNILVSSGLLARLPDLDDAWDALMRWYHEQPLLLVGNISDGSFGTNGNVSHVVGGNATGMGRTNQIAGNEGGAFVGGSDDRASPANDGIANDLDHGNRDSIPDHKNNHQGGHHQGQHIRRRRKARPHHHHR